MKLTASQFNARQANRNNFLVFNTFRYNNIRLFNENNTLFFSENACTKIKNWSSLAPDSNKAFNEALDAINLLIEFGSNKDTILREAQFLVTEMNKVRDATQLKNSIKYKLSRIKTKLTGFLRRSDATTSAADKAIDNLKQANPISSAPSSSPDIDDSERPDIATEVYSILSDGASAIYEIDRIIEHYARIHKRFNIDNIFSECAAGNRDLYDAIYTVAGYIDTYNSPFKNRYNAALETVWYGLSKKFIAYENSTIVNTVTDYYLFNGGLSESNKSDIKDIIRISPLFEEYDFNDLSELLDNDQDADDNPINNPDDVLEQDLYLDTLREMQASAFERISGIKASQIPTENHKEYVSDLLSKFRKSCVSPDSNSLTIFKGIVVELISHPQEIIPQLKSILVICRMAFITSGTEENIDGICKIIGDFTSALIDIPMNKPQADMVTNIYKSEYDTINHKIESLSNTDSDQNARYSKYTTTLKQQIDTIAEYIGNVGDDMTEVDSEHPTDDDPDGNPEDQSTTEEDMKEAATLALAANLLESISHQLQNKSIDSILESNISFLSDDTISGIVELAITCPAIINPEKLRYTIESHRNDLRKSKEKRFSNYIRIDTLNENINNLNKPQHYTTSEDLIGNIAFLMCVNEIFNIDTHSKSIYFTEGMSFINTLKLAVNNLRRKVVDLKEADKRGAETLDGAINALMSSMNKDMSAARREQIARGSILPNASKCIKILLVCAGAGLIFQSVAVAIIGAVGAFFLDARATHKERQLALDEIEVELKMCDRYIQLYESQNKFQELRQCEMIKRNLTRQHQRIKYRMKIDFKHADSSTVALKDSD